MKARYKPAREKSESVLDYLKPGDVFVFTSGVCVYIRGMGALDFFKLSTGEQCFADGWSRVTPLCPVSVNFEGAVVFEPVEG